jgi:phosphate starvation-inducible PhoH-like protein
MIRFELSPPDNARLMNLCGPLDENLRQLENALDVSISRRGGRFAVAGEAARRAAALIERFYGQTQDKTLGVDDIQLGTMQQADEDGDAGPFAALPAPSTTGVHGRTPRQGEYLQAIAAHDISFGVGPAGTGKTYLAVASAIDAFERGQSERIILARPAVEAGERLGFLPGDLTQKVDPYLRPLYDALYDLAGFARVNRLFEKGALEIAPLAFMRGRTLNHAFIILDEAQNTTPEQMKMFLTRIGIGAKAVVTGDPSQVDLPHGQKSGLAEALEILSDVRGIAIVRFQKEDVVRHPLVARILEAYEAKEAGARRAAARRPGAPGQAPAPASAAQGG